MRRVERQAIGVASASWFRCSRRPGLFTSRSLGAVAWRAEASQAVMPRERVAPRSDRMPMVDMARRTNDAARLALLAQRGEGEMRFSQPQPACGAIGPLSHALALQSVVPMQAAPSAVRRAARNSVRAVANLARAARRGARLLGRALPKIQSSNCLRSACLGSSCQSGKSHPSIASGGGGLPTRTHSAGTGPQLARIQITRISAALPRIVRAGHWLTRNWPA